MEGTSFFSESKAKGRMLVKNLVKHKNKIVTSDVDIIIMVYACCLQRRTMFFVML